MKLWIDGGCSGNSQTDLSKRRMCGAVATEDGSIVAQFSERVGGSNNVAELQALVEALRWCETHNVADVAIFTDSWNTVHWSKCRKLGKRLNDREAVLALQAFIAACRVKFSLTWIPRAQNLAGHYLERRFSL